MDELLKGGKVNGRLASSDGRKPRPLILLVDDRPEGLLTLEAVLGDTGADFIKASSGAEAVRFAGEHDFAVILLDVQMPVMDGFEAAARIKKNDRSRDVPILFITAINKDERHIYRGYESGAVDYIFKPFDPYILRAKVDVFLDLYRKNQKLREQAALLREADRHERERVLAQLELENLKRYRNLADAIPHAVVKALPNGTPEHFNRTWYETTGASPLSMSGWSAYFASEDFARLQSVWKDAMRTGASFEEEVRLRRVVDGEERWHLVRGVAEKGPVGETSAWILTCTDIHDRKQVEVDNLRLMEETRRALQRSEEHAKALEVSNHDLEQFAYVASHDLQEPLRKVISYSNLLQQRLDSLIEGESKRYFSYVLEGAARMQSLIQGLLSYSRVQVRGKRHERVDLEKLFEEARNTLRDVIQDTGARITCDKLPNITVEPVQIGQVFQNLIANALKFRGPSAPEVHVSAEKRGGEWMFSVRDNGIGIDPKYKDRIFIIFQRLHSQSRFPGSGIGLAICKKIIERHGGRIWVESAAGAGATFFFTLPTRSLAGAEAPAAGVH